MLAFFFSMKISGKVCSALSHSMSRKLFPSIADIRPFLFGGPARFDYRFDYYMVYMIL